MRMPAIVERRREESVVPSAVLGVVTGLAIGMLLSRGFPARHRLGDELAPGLYAREVDYLVRHEWARTADDILWRRTKLGLRATPADVRRVQEYVSELDQASSRAGRA